MWNGANWTSRRKSTHRLTSASKQSHLVLLLAFAIGLAWAPSANGFDQDAGEDELVVSMQVELDLGSLGVFRPTLVGRKRMSRTGGQNAGNGQEAIFTEILSMQLRAPSPLGPVTVRKASNRQSHGVIWQSAPGVDFPAKSRLSLFFEILSQVGTFHTNEPVVVEAMIDDIPPCGARHRTPETFQGVILVGENGQSVGMVREVIYSFCQQPTFSVAPQGASSLNAADLFQVRRDLDGPPSIRAADLGLQTTGDDVDGLSYGLDFIDVFMELFFSVDEEATGLGGTGVEGEAENGEAHGDEFWMSFFGRRGTNALAMDEEEFELRVSDDVDALAEPPASAGDSNGDGIPDSAVYFSLSEGSVTLSGNDFSPADILQSSGGGPPSVFIRFDELGLVEEDDIDAFCLLTFEGDDSAVIRQVVFSLAPGSPSLQEDAANTSDRRSPADLFLTNAADPSEMPMLSDPLLAAAQLGLRDIDNLNALKCVQAEKDYQPHSVLRIEIDGEEVDLWGDSIMLWAIGRNGESDRTSQGTDFARGQIPSIYLQGTTPSGRNVMARIRPASKSPGQQSLMTLQEDGTSSETDDIPWFLQLWPWGDYEGGLFIDFYLELDVDGEILHNEDVIVLYGIVTKKPPALNEAAQRFEQSTPTALRHKTLAPATEFRREAADQQSNGSSGPGDRGQDFPPIELLTEDGQPSGTSLSTVIFFPNVSAGAPLVPGGAVVSAASYRQAAAPESILAVFGADLSQDSDEATELPLPTELAGTSVTVTDSSGNQAVAALSLGPAQQDALAPLFFVSPAQINFFLPAGLALGPATVDVTRANGSVASTSVLIVPTAPGIFSIDGTGSGVAFASYLLVEADDSRTQEFIFDPDTRQAVPVNLGAEGDQLYLLLGGTGIRGFTGEITATVGGRNVAVLGAAAQGEFVGLDQVNIGPLPRELAGAGEVDIVLTVDGQESNAVTVTIE